MIRRPVRPRSPVRAISLVSLAGLILVGCAVDPRWDSSTVRDSVGVEIVENARPRWAAGDAWTLGDEPFVVLHAFDDTPENRLLDPMSIDVDGWGRILVADGWVAGWQAVLVYDSLGNFEFQVGREGEGPGEFTQLQWAEAYRGDSIAAYDVRRKEISIFDREGAFARSVQVRDFPVETAPPSTRGYFAGADRAYPDGYFLAYPSGTLDTSAGPGPAWQKHALVRLAPDGSAWDTLGRFEIYQDYWSGSEQEQLQYAAYSTTAVDADYLYFARGDRFEVSQFDHAGQLERIIRRAHSPTPVSDDLRTRMVDWIIDISRSTSNLPEDFFERLRPKLLVEPWAETLPAVSAVLIDDLGFVWVEEYRWFQRHSRSPIVDAARWSVFSPEGVWLGDVQMPPGFILHRVTTDRALGFSVSELDERQVHVFRLTRDPPAIGNR